MGVFFLIVQTLDKPIVMMEMAMMMMEWHELIGDRRMLMLWLGNNNMVNISYFMTCNILYL